eukprot:453943_1
MSQLSQKIMKECLTIFERTQMPTILPNPEFTDIVSNQAERQVMMKAGLNAIPKHFSEIGRACYFGDYDLYLILIKLKNITNFNTYFEGESRWSLMHFVMFGRKQILSSNPSMTTAQLNQDFNHIKIAQHLIDNNLYINIQSKWGFSALHESVINYPDLYFTAFLLKNGSEPNIKNIFGDTPLHSAVIGSDIESIKLLCRYGADPRIEEEFSGLTALYLGRLHIEISAILNNQKRKLELSQMKLECENISNCSTCNASAKDKKLYLCSKCRDYNTKYCSINCQKIDYKSHKINCKKNNRKMDASHTGNGLVFNVISAQGAITANTDQRLTTVMHETYSKHSSKHFEKNIRFGSDEWEQDRKQYQKKAQKNMHKELERLNKKSLKKINTLNKIILNEKFIIKIQIPRRDAPVKDKLLVYNKKRTYMVFIDMNQ